ncbi:Aminodeoxychorismate lyase [Teratosphaeriaceae sp. CCFEE 6253]|nr:Aminodeoxychorismate lyase [Teratosphaeriaceae sp. CCFEE 6253]
MGIPSGHEDEPYIFTTIRWDPTFAACAENTGASADLPCPFYMLEHHRTRLNAASVAKWRRPFAKDGTSDLLSTLTSAVQQWHAKHPEETLESLRITALHRIAIDRCFPFGFGVPEDRPDDIEWTICLAQASVDSSVDTKHKTSDRAVYERARASAGITDFKQTKEVLLYDHQGAVLDASICTPYFFRDGRWITPRTEHGGQQGTTRRWALEQGFCVEGTVKKEDLRAGEVVWLSNAVRGYFRAVYRPI